MSHDNADTVFVKNSKLKTLKQSGQATLEYALMLFVIISIFVGFIVGISESTRRFADNYFGAYLTCLLETGELPRLDADGIPETECDDLFQPFELATGRVPNDNTGSPGGSSGSNDNDNSSDNDSSDDDNSSKNSNADSDSGDDDSGGSEGSDGGGGADGPSSQFGANRGGRSGKVPTTSADRRGGGDSSKTDTLKGTNNFGSSDDGDDSFGSGRVVYVPINGSGGDDEEDIVSAESINAGEVEAGRSERVSKIIPNAKRTTQSENDGLDDGLSFGDFLKYLVIVIIVLVIIIVVGGQILQFQKSQE